MGARGKGRRALHERGVLQTMFPATQPQPHPHPHPHLRLRVRSKDMMKRLPDAMSEAIPLHNTIIRNAKWAFCGSVVEQEGDAFMIVFHEPLDAVAFCLQVRQRRGGTGCGERA